LNFNYYKLATIAFSAVFLFLEVADFDSFNAADLIRRAAVPFFVRFTAVFFATFFAIF